jgi:hypothetical protein
MKSDHYDSVMMTGAFPRFDPVRFDAFAQLLARTDPKGLPRRAHVPRWQGDPDRRGTRLPGILMAWMQRRHLEIDVEECVAPATRTALVSRPAASSFGVQSPAVAN